MSNLRMRTIPEAYRELKNADPYTALTLSGLRRLINEGKIPSTDIGKKRLINLDTLFEVLGTTEAEPKKQTTEFKASGIKPLKVVNGSSL